MIRPLPREVELLRVTSGVLGSTSELGNNGYFLVPAPGSASMMKVVASDQMDWEHVSVSIHRQDRCPTWDEMCFVKDMFWHPHECVIQFHPPAEIYVKFHPYVLHLWKPTDIEIPVPHPMLVGPMS